MGYNTKFIANRFNNVSAETGQVVYEVHHPIIGQNVRFLFLDPEKLTFRHKVALRIMLGSLKVMVKARRNQGLCRPLMDICELGHLAGKVDDEVQREVAEKLTKLFTAWLGGNYLPFILGEALGKHYSVGSGDYQTIRLVWLEKQMQLLS